MSSDPSPIRILSVDDHPLIRKGVAGLVATQADMNLVAEAADGREALQLFHRHRPDITLMDLQMPEMSGLDAIIARVSQPFVVRREVLGKGQREGRMSGASESCAHRTFDLHYAALIASDANIDALASEAQVPQRH